VHHPNPSDLTLGPPIARLRAVPGIDALAADGGVDGALGVLTRSFAEQVAATTALLLVFDDDSDVAYAHGSWGLGETMGLGIRRGEGAAGRVLHTGRAATFPLMAADGDPLTPSGDRAAITSVVGAPVRSPEGIAGALCAGLSRTPRAERGQLLWTAEAYAAVAGLCLDGTGFLGALAEAARRDRLTACLNFGALQEATAREIGRCARHGHALSCCFLDLDGFKAVNDAHGHRVGNRALTAVADALRDGVRTSDLVGRYGGDEFVVVLPETGQGRALSLAQRLRADIASATAAAIGEPVGVSAGVAEWAPGWSAEMLLEQADQGLRIAKESGGGAVALPAGPEPHRSWRRRSTRPRRAKRNHPLLTIRKMRAPRASVSEHQP
jgi:diguanylate cyclase (GGDEF)-like protein